MLMLSGEGPINPQTTFSLLLEVLEINKIKPKKASKPQFYPIIPPKTHSSVTTSVQMTQKLFYNVDAARCRPYHPLKHLQ